MGERARYESDCVERFLRYVTIDTQSREGSSSFPSTPGQWDLLRLLERELLELGLDDVELDEHGYLFGTIPSTSERPEVPTFGLLAHVDTSPEMSGAGVKPIVHRAWDGSPIALPDDPSVVLDPAADDALRARIGDDIVTASGTTLLGADNKAGVAEIVGAAAFLQTHPEVRHGPIRVGFTPDEEIGRGAEHFDVARFGAVCAYTMDGSTRGELQAETFSADSLLVTFHGTNTHPGFATGRMVNAIKAASRFVAALPADRLSPETTAGREGFVHPYVLEGGVERASVKLLLRSFEDDELVEQRALVERLARESAGGTRVETAHERSYRNMRAELDRHPRVVELAREAIRSAGLVPIEEPIRGGTDGSRLTAMGLPTPNIFAGEHNFHSRSEWVSTADMHKAVEVIVELARLWEREGA